jgi:flagellar protein FlaJ
LKASEKFFVLTVFVLVFSSATHALGKQEWHYCLFLGSVTAVIAFLACKKIPEHKEKQRVKKVEKELPLALRFLATQLSVGISFESCLKSVCTGFGELSKDFQEVNFLVESGKSVPEALFHWTEKTKSCFVGQAVMQLTLTYESGKNPEGLKKLADELVEKQLMEAKDYSSQLALASLGFITVSALFPALFQAFVMVGTTFLYSTLTPLQALLIPVLVFPLIDLAVMAGIKLRKPVMA